jgi:Domain of unknown function (DUF4123)
MPVPLKELYINYILLDAARVGDELMQKAKEMNPNHENLYLGEEGKELESVAPFLFLVQPNTPFADWVLEKGWGDSWATFFYSTMDFASLYRHFRKYLIVKQEDGTQLYFRFYDPRVMRIVLPTFDDKQLKEFFENVTLVFCEDQQPNKGLYFQYQNNQLVSASIQV